MCAQMLRRKGIQKWYEYGCWVRGVHGRDLFSRYGVGYVVDFI